MMYDFESTYKNCSNADNTHLQNYENIMKGMQSLRKSWYLVTGNVNVN